MTKILFIHPKFPVNKRHKLVLPISAARIAAYLKKYNTDIELFSFDAHFNNSTNESVLEYVKEINPDIVAMGFWTCQAPHVYELSKEIKKQNEKIIIIHGGIHVTFNYQESLETSDIAILGEAEKTFSDTINAIQNNISYDKIPGIAFKNPKVVKTQSQPLIEDLNTIPMPLYKLFDIKSYIPHEKFRDLHVVGGKRMPIIGSRGCPYDCNFCLSPQMWHKRVRFRSPKKIIEELEYVYKEFNLSNFQFYDDNFLINREFLTEFCYLVEKLEFKIQWVCLSRAEHIIQNKDLLDSIKKAGCVGIEMGLESGDNKIQDNLSKGQSMDMLKAAIKLQQDHGLFPLYTIMAFCPGETISSFEVLRSFVETQMPETTTHNHFGSESYITLGQFATPYAGTEFFNNRHEQGMTLVDDWSDYFHHQLNFIPNSLLQDIPITKKPITKEAIKHCVEIANNSLFKYFPDNKNDLDMENIAKKFFSNCDGKNNFEEIASIISKELNIDTTKTLRFCAVSAIVLAQERFIGSR